MNYDTVWHLANSDELLGYSIYLIIRNEQYFQLSTSNFLEKLDSFEFGIEPKKKKCSFSYVITFLVNGSNRL